MVQFYYEKNFPLKNRIFDKKKLPAIFKLLNSNFIHYNIDWIFNIQQDINVTVALF